ncbi:SDR family oxidoreductase [Mameliella sp. CS4]|uniref:SDR family oxidoreductase n=1 Tax=Mameliella sp. CS4 TaxID=2862329 RepID=UPI001C5F5DDA|nr:SDR family oxidoreductase [Mameliella sp. CS4]MBW4981781.1 SDR family oxidoreductase [Mameliella sp. CS4]
MTKTLLSLGHGYSARALAPLLLSEGWEVIGTTRDPAKLEAMRATGVTPILWQEDSVSEALDRATHLLMSAAPDAEGDPALRLAGPAIAARAPDIEWAGYLSTTGVYGDHRGGWVTEDTPLDPATRRGQLRVEAETAWAAVPGLPLHIFRLAGIYGPGRGPFAKLRKGTARRIIKPNQVFSRIHVEDIAQVLRTSIARPNPGAAYNLCDNAPAPPQDVIACAAEMLGMPIPPEVPFEEADLSPMARSFYGESKRVCNARIKEELGVTLRYPDYRSALAAILAAEQASGG